MLGLCVSATFLIGFIHIDVVLYNNQSYHQNDIQSALYGRAAPKNGNNFNALFLCYLVDFSFCSQSQLMRFDFNINFDFHIPIATLHIGLAPIVQMCYDYRSKNEFLLQKRESESLKRRKSIKYFFIFRHLFCFCFALFTDFDSLIFRVHIVT